MVFRDGGGTFSESAELNPVWKPCVCCTTSVSYGVNVMLALLHHEETEDE